MTQIEHFRLFTNASYLNLQSAVPTHFHAERQFVGESGIGSRVPVFMGRFHDGFIGAPGTAPPGPSGLDRVIKTVVVEGTENIPLSPSVLRISFHFHRTLLYDLSAVESLITAIAGDCILG